MLKVLIILILIGYVFFKITSVIFSGFFRVFSHQGKHANYTRNTPEGTIHIDSNPRNSSKKPSGYNGGEYVDFEEVK